MTADYEKLKRRQLNAIKHGVFSSTATLPGEDEAEYAVLIEAFCKEWNPEGPTETDAVFTSTNCVWRKRRIREFIAKKVRLRPLDFDHPAFEPDLMLATVKVLLQLDPKHLENFIEENAFIRKHLESKFPKNICDTLDPADLAKKSNINDLEELFARRRPPEPAPSRELRSVDVLGEDIFKQELAMEERLDAMIDRAVKRLVQAKAMKQMLASPALKGHAQQRKRISASNGAEPHPPCPRHTWRTLQLATLSRAN